MAEKKLSEELRRCLEYGVCRECEFYQSQKATMVCKGLLQKAYEAVKRCEEMFPCKVGDKLYSPNQYTKMIAVFEVVEIFTFKDGTVIIDDLENEWTSKDIGKTVFLEKEAAEKALKEMEDRKNGEINRKNKHDG